ncbi:tyrosine-type recombinase/integrase [Lacrimispora amygdalina]
MRHTFCTRLCENESNLKVIQSVMGHVDIQTTMNIYAECTMEK